MNATVAEWIGGRPRTESSANPKSGRASRIARDVGAILNYDQVRASRVDERMRMMEGAGAPDPFAGPAVQAAEDWVDPPPSSGGLQHYLYVLRARWWLIALAVAVAVTSAALAVAATDKEYAAEADVLVTPIPDNNENLFGLGLVSESGDPTRDAETLARLITTYPVAQRVRTTLGLSQPARSLLKHVSAEPVAQSSIVTITARAGDADRAARLANAFGEATIEVRTERLHTLLDSIIPPLRRQLDALPGDETRATDALSTKLENLETLRLLPDPTIHLETRALPPTNATAPRPFLMIAAAFIGALVLGAGAVLGAHVLDPRIEREDELRRYRIPILGRIPLEPLPRRLGRHAPFAPDELSPPTLDAFHRLASSLAARAGNDNPAIVVTGAAPGDGKTTTAINLAARLGALGDRVLLMEGDSRRPSLARTFGSAPGPDLSDVVAGRHRLIEALNESDRLPAGVRFIAQDPAELAAPATVSPDVADALVSASKQLSNWLVVDAPALNYAPDLLPLAKRVDRVLLVVRLGATRARDLADLAELLAQQGIKPEGFIVIGGKARRRPIYDGRLTARQS
jgi:Mrp family chromosome partitioning ATPase/capsular polysaccharide biosynthesis protein